jgi:hypothetical protein
LFYSPAPGAAIYSSRDDTQLRSYNAAPLCASLDDALAGKDCRYTVAATITDSAGDGTGTDLFFDIPGASGGSYWARVPGNTSLTVGSQVQLEFWMMRVTKVGNTITVDNPAGDPRSGNLLEIGLLLALLGIGALLMARRSWRDDRNQPSTGAALRPIATSDLLNH